MDKIVIASERPGIDERLMGLLKAVFPDCEVYEVYSTGPGIKTHGTELQVTGHASKTQSDS